MKKEEIEMLKEKGIKIPDGVNVFDWNDNRTEIHPALDFNCNVAYTSQIIPMIIDNETKDVMVILGSDRSITPLISDDSLKKGNLKLKYIPNIIDNRWSLQGMRKFLTEKEKTLDMKELFDKVKSQIKYYLELPDERMYNVLACWCIGTYFYPMFNTYPYVFLNAIKRAGKSKLLTLMYCMCFNAKFSLSVTPATIFRLIQGNRCTLLMDETENLRNKDMIDYRSMLLAGYKKGAKVPRSHENKKKQYEVSEYDVYGPKMLANISGIEDVLEDRCITLILLRAKSGVIGNREIDIEDDIWQNIRDELYVNLMLNWKEIQHKYNLVSDLCLNISEGNGSIDKDMNIVNVGVCLESRNLLKPPLLSPQNTTLPSLCSLTSISSKLKRIRQRDLELWLPIFSIGLAIDDQLFEDLIDYSLVNLKEKEAESTSENNDSILIEVLSDMILNDDYYSIKEIHNKMYNFFGYGEGEKDGKWLSVKWVGYALRRLGFKDKRRRGTGYEYRMNPAYVRDLAERSGINLEKFVSKQSSLNDPASAEINKTGETI